MMVLNVSATELIYRPVSPLFTGNPGTNSYLSSSYRTQKQEPREQRSELERLQQSLQSRLLSEVLRDLSDPESDIFDEGSVTLNSGDVLITATREDGDLTILLNDGSEDVTIFVENYFPSE